jgi:tRNA-specific 2-thiouridylase
MSGGVDSTLTALLLKEHGCKVIGATMSMWNNQYNIKSTGIRRSCYSPDEQVDIDACKKFCSENNIEYYIIDVSNIYNEEVLNYFNFEYLNGNTPNPCIKCNEFVKFGAFIDGINKLKIEFDYFCTGHYAKLIKPKISIGEIFGDVNNGIYPIMIKNANDITKDQTYFLYRINQHVLNKVRFPLGNLTKKQVYELANERNLISAKKKESQDFIPKDIIKIIFKDESKIGNIIDLETNKVIGKHRGLKYYTIGQRKGIGLVSKSCNSYYVYKIDAENNSIVVSNKSKMLIDSIIISNTKFNGNYHPTKMFYGNVKYRSGCNYYNGIIEYIDNDFYKITFDIQCLPVGIGQSLVIYINNIIVGGGFVKENHYI